MDRSIRVLLVLLSALWLGCAFARLERVAVDGQSEQTPSLQDLQVRRAGASLASRAGMELEKGDEIETGRRTTAVVRFRSFPGSVLAILGRETRVRLENPNLFVFFGFVDLRGFFRSETEYVTAASEGTEFAMEVSRSGSTTVLTVLDGNVRLSSRAGAWPAVRLAKFQEARLSGGGSPSIQRVSPERFNEIVHRINLASPEPLTPDVRGLPRAEAEQRLAELGLAVGRVTPVPAHGAEVGRVQGQDPEPGRPAGRRGVRLEVGEPAVLVPNLVGRARAEAEHELERLGLRSHLELRITGAREGIVLDQDPAPGREVVAGETVRLVIEGPSVIVPQVEGMPLEAARQRLAAAGLRVGGVTPHETAEHPVDTVIRQSSRAGSRVEPGTTVDLTVAKPPPPPQPQPVT